MWQLLLLVVAVLLMFLHNYDNSRYAFYIKFQSGVWIIEKRGTLPQKIYFLTMNVYIQRICVWEYMLEVFVNK